MQVDASTVTLILTSLIRICYRSSGNACRNDINFDSGPNCQSSMFSSMEEMEAI